MRAFSFGSSPILVKIASAISEIVVNPKNVMVVDTINLLVVDTIAEKVV